MVTDFPETGPGCTCDGAQVSLKRVFGVLNDMKSDDHIVFVLRFIERNTHGEIAEYCGWSLTTARRRIHRAKDAFIKRAGRDAILSGWIDGYETGYVI
jgi:DNA-directed RNA polymerase specialized sigma24 family protein